jgi:hypothetical protein
MPSCDVPRGWQLLNDGDCLSNLPLLGTWIAGDISPKNGRKKKEDYK